MPITKGAQKAHRASLNKRVFNIRRRNIMNDTIKKVRSLIASGDAKAAQEALPETYKAIDKAAKRGIIKKNTAARKKSRLTTSLKNTNS